MNCESEVENMSHKAESDKLVGTFGISRASENGWSYKIGLTIQKMQVIVT